MTRARHQLDYKSSDAEGRFSWFDIVILESPDATTPKIQNGVTLAWFSHSNGYSDISRDPRAGQMFDQGEDQQKRSKEIHEIKAALAVSSRHIFQELY